VSVTAPGMVTTALPIEHGSGRGPGGRQPGAGRKPTHGGAVMRRTLRTLTTRRLDGRSALAVAVRNWKADVRRDLGGDLSRAQETILEATAQAWIILTSLDDYIARQPSLVTKRRQLLPVVVQRMQVADSLARNLERLGLGRRARDVEDLGAYLAQQSKRPEIAKKGPGERSEESAGRPHGAAHVGAPGQGHTG